MYIETKDLQQLIAKYTETTPTYKPGDSVRVTKNRSGHEFEINSIVTLEEYNTKDKDWFCVKDEKGWYLTEEEFEPIN